MILSNTEAFARFVRKHGLGSIKAIIDNDDFSNRGGFHLSIPSGNLSPEHRSILIRLFGETDEATRQRSLRTVGSAPYITLEGSFTDPEITVEHHQAVGEYITWRERDQAAEAGTPLDLDEEGRLKAPRVTTIPLRVTLTISDPFKCTKVGEETERVEMTDDRRKARQEQIDRLQAELDSGFATITKPIYDCR